MKADPSANLNPASRAITSAVASSSQFPELSAVSLSLSLSTHSIPPTPLSLSTHSIPPTPLLLLLIFLFSLSSILTQLINPLPCQSLHISAAYSFSSPSEPCPPSPDSGLRARGTNIAYSRYNNNTLAALDAIGERAGLFPSFR